MIIDRNNNRNNNYATTARILEDVVKAKDRIMKAGDNYYKVYKAVRDGDIIHPIWEDYGLITNIDGTARAP
jgi:hypothetical protein